MNELSQETSPYLLQHANNPVHWKAWNDKTLESAIDNNKLILISVGYSACHWCHVMEHETFEDQEAATLMNAHFVNIKVDREERPDVDAVYMKAVQLMTQRGGWPMNVVALPDGRPVWGGTYFRKGDWMQTLDHLARLWQNEPEKMVDYAGKLHAGLEALNILPNENPSGHFPEQSKLEELLAKWSKSFDWEFGGYQKAPKFMLPNNFKFLLRYGFQTQNPDLLDFVNLTLTKMATGGIFDTVGGGFSRYSVDFKWHVPHFEKMLYDNGQLVSLYSDAYKLTGNPLYAEIVEKTLAFVSRELLGKDGNFYSALDADSKNDNGQSEEGAFYVWTKSELEKLLGEDFTLFSEVFSINDFGHWEHGRYVFIQKHTVEELSEIHKIPLTELQSKKKNWEQILFTEREKRHRPGLDDKSLTSWNAIMLKGFVDAYKALGRPEYLKTALKNAEFIQNKCWASDGNLWHSYKNGKSTINAYLEDYAFVIDAFIALYEVTLDEKFLTQAKQLCDYCFDHFYDAEQGFFLFTSNLDKALAASHYEMEDNVIPASNSVMCENLYRLSIYFGNQHYETKCENMLSHIVPVIDYASAFSNWLNVFLNFSDKQRELAICGENALSEMAEVNAFYLPHLTLAATSSGSRLPFLENRFQSGQNLYYVCQNQTCQLPETDLASVLKNL
ncbi:thioredoxin domain-containing protein [Flavobacterium sp. MAH-1]|uniref:Thioredoxin domain-containing protein n=1 Tax=Flavobacterium agri TaxID=2743471 RepID=A0A7Y8Y304_9FLAO|nr:thioredoxin domain-containing protein [Flavobacterium agri]NUY81625.1 thioredoxin domain-containing protein [Flavobacterium agri]NYA71649.1 thioredoxin domain-containing protein [Flavobacterium agri]